ncbi:MAG: hypothetical protein ACRDJW_09260, partial [Thermomicrobiales bacterium]
MPKVGHPLLRVLTALALVLSLSFAAPSVTRAQIGGLDLLDILDGEDDDGGDDGLLDLGGDDGLLDLGGDDLFDAVDDLLDVFDSDDTDDLVDTLDDALDLFDDADAADDEDDDGIADALDD